MQTTKKNDDGYYRHTTLVVTEAGVTGIVMRDSFYAIDVLVNDQHVRLRHPRTGGGPTEYSIDAGVTWQPISSGQKRQ